MTEGPFYYAVLGNFYTLNGEPDKGIAEAKKNTDEFWKLYGLAFFYGAMGIKQNQMPSVDINKKVRTTLARFRLPRSMPGGERRRRHLNGLIAPMYSTILA